MSRKRQDSAQDQFERDANKQYERCMVDSPEMIEYKKKPDLTIDEIAELRCKPFACRLQICMSLPNKQRPYHRDVYTGEYYHIDNPCTSAHSDFTSCVDNERRNILNENTKSLI